MDIWVFPFLVVTSNAATNISACVFVLLFLLSICVGVELLGRIIIPYLPFLRKYLFSKVLASFYILIRNV